MKSHPSPPDSSASLFETGADGWIRCRCPVLEAINLGSRNAARIHSRRGGEGPALSVRRSDHRRLRLGSSLLLGVLLFGGQATWADELVTPTWSYVYDHGYGHDSVRGVALDRAGVLAAAGILRGNTSPDYMDAACLMRFGTPGWTDILDLGPVQPGVRDEASDRFYDVATDSQDHVLVVGNKSGAWAGGDGYHVAALVRKYSPTGTLLWERLQSFGAWSTAYGVAVDGADNIYVGGMVFGNWTIEEGQWAIWKYDPAGALQAGYPIYYNFASGSGAYEYQDMAFDLAVDGTGGLVAVGRRGVAKGNVDWHVRKYDASRALVWEDTYAGAGGGTDDAYEVVADREGNFVVAGYTLKAANDYDWLVIKYRGSDGHRLWTRSFESGAGRSEACYAVAVDGLDNALVGGYERGADGTMHWRLEHLAKGDGQLLAAQVWPSAQDEVLYAVAYRDRQIALGGSQSNGNNNDWLVIVAVPPPSGITRCDWTAPNLLTLEWQGAMEPVTLLHSPVLAPAEWQPVAGPLLESGWTGPVPASGGFLRLRER